MNRDLNCPVCGDVLNNLQCENEECSFSTDYTIMRNDISVDEAIQQLISHGAYVNANTETLIIPGRMESRYSMGGEQASYLASFMRSQYGMTQRAMQANTAHSVFNKLRSEQTNMPYVHRTGDYPLMYRIDGHLQFMNQRIRDGYLYRGPNLTPREHGGVFDEWVASFRWATKEDYWLLRAWLLSLFAQPGISCGRFPALLFTTHSGSSVGKTESANMISKIFGRMLSRFWNQKVAEEVDRLLLSGNHRFFCADNLVANRGGRGAIDSSSLAEFITKDFVEAKRLYSTGGTAHIEKPTVDILTANTTTISLDLLQRMVIVGLTNKPISGSSDWVGEWAGRRQEILEEGMWIVQENSKKFRREKIEHCGYTDFRYPQWYEMALECAGHTHLNPYPRDCCVASPLDDVVRVEKGEKKSLSMVMEDLTGKVNVRAKKLLDQLGHVTEEKVENIIRRWSKEFEIVENKEGETCIQTKNS